METDNSAVPENGLARFACDYCRQKKFRCSKELPKCSACKPWSSSCNYSRDKPAGSQSHVLLEPKPPTGAQAVTSATDIESRLQNIEHIVERLTQSVDQIVAAVVPKKLARNPSVSFPNVTSGSAGPSNTITAEHKDPAPNLFIRPAHAFSFLKETKAQIDAIKKASTRLAHQTAYSELQYLSSSLTTATVGSEATKGAKTFYVPSKAAGYQLMGRFLEHSPQGEPFFRSPPDDLLQQVIFDPGNVKQKAWVVYVNYMMLALVSAREKEESSEAKHFRRNMQLALNDSTIFLEPNEVNLQTLALLAMHGEDYASPNLSWMLVGHACRQAEAIGLHQPNHSDYESQQRSLCMFWLLFVVDKSCSLAFGRSSFLPVGLYRDVPLPDFNYMLKFQPHNEPDFRNSRNPSQVSTFGAHYLTQGMKLARLMGDVLTLLIPGQPYVRREEVRVQLETWHKETNQVLYETLDKERSSTAEAHLREMSLGITSMKFQYLHIVIVLHKGDPACAKILLESAREALSLLPHMVSNWSSIYNGVVWHLLYYPFIPFFVVFEHIVHDKTSNASSKTNNDISLLSTTVSYFSSMRAQLRLLAPVCARLEHVASIFLQLAQAHANERRLPHSGEPKVNSVFPSSAPPLSTQFLGHGDNERIASVFQTVNEDEGIIADLDISTLLDWLPADTAASWPVEFTATSQQSRAGTAFNSSLITEEQTERASRGRKRTFDATFDWFSWDTYYTDSGSRRAFS
ncbi:fungal specific transcription factor domain-containing protein [Colletotrichum truncatum]|uniref:Fungal specific transcription factor domain-containing protein n=1 Tax=Colletotrichum truncatum TaxID=5467 RepID=A0ACC3YKB0_COLTU|nr:fungal specific transcription factor domain-containing protein [Colletotrichum truncatum]KAF6784379.1 fungal specific transcription factor domain-containing protein [Colletotrichum truncatum]